MGLNVKGAPAQKSKTDYDKHLTAKPASGMVSVETKTAGNEWAGSVAESKVEVPGLFTSNGMSITVGGGQTINMGNYNSARIDVSITVPCDPHTLEDAYTWALNWCSEKITAAADDAKGVA